ncbi:MULTISPECIES: universal stress protein [Psychrobacter]|jgi:universal stress protein A|uniref:universal stress protein n=1 Tax=Psychrobacter TaxID=497 RepID=UPI00086C3275|nr:MULTISPECIES: universal stress protein [Psychrobacter]MBA6244623.1 universal stress protein [Psychrobacter sp. Urea-trap-18]MBA6285123.1 universal stress protein [Psychrobacter sp. Urea-trap-16]MBA6319526.1 universal stress protein [Psychrobacter sp. Urea-trap-20]MBA6334099.1 universal stress protein [Psychrobacter sp. Urea-trap-19]OEH67458.1 MAG: universal stress protein [Psychrobacter sp. B29-1]|tara:strand:- start:51977 stop:52438 length:462 start_codon:yes stop_codon:yes gene_type:complete
MSYQHVLLVTDLLSDADKVALKAKRILAGSPEARLSVLHIVKDDMVRFGYELVPASSLSGNVDNEKWQEARAKLAQFLARNELEAINSEVTAAISNSKGIINYCREKDVDLLIIGRHERHGIAAWLVGATADSILPNVPCDSLVVKLDQPVLE